MKPVIEQISNAVKLVIADEFGCDTDPQVTLAQNPKFGDYQINVAMGLAKKLSSSGQKTNPRAVAEQIVAKLDLKDLAEEISIAGPGFINVSLDSNWIAKQAAVNLSDERLGAEPVPDPKTIVVDYSGPNVSKQMHVGHLRSTNIGDCLSRVLSFLGHKVIRQNHIGDWGTQFGMLLRFLQESNLTKADNHIADLEEFYRTAKKRFDEDPNFATEARRMVVQLQSGDAQAVALWRKIFDESRICYEATYRQMNVLLTRADECGESFYNPRLPSTVAELKEKGIAVDDEGAVVVRTEGFEAPLIIQKSDGGYGYDTTDVAAARYRSQELKAHRIIYVTDARQAQHFKQVFDTVKRAGWVEGSELQHIPFGTVLGDDGKPFKTRSGGVVLLKALLDEAEDRALTLVEQKLNERGIEMPIEQRKAIARAVGVGAIKYFDLNRDPGSNYVFAWDKMLALDGNTAPYLQYAYARIQSIFRKAQQLGISQTDSNITIGTGWEGTLAKRLLMFSETIGFVARELKPHYLCNYLYDLATDFSSFYENCPVLQDRGALSSSRLNLCELTGRTVALGLDLLGIEHPSQM